MKFESVLPAFREGKKIRLKSFAKDFSIESKYTNTIPTEYLLSDDWEIVEEPKRPIRTTVWMGEPFAPCSTVEQQKLTLDFEDFLMDTLNKVNTTFRITVEEMK